MSTRSQILFKNVHRWEEDGEKEERTEEVLTYKHHDGYVKSTVPTLREFYHYAGSRANDLEYFVATWPYWYKRQKERRDRASSYSDLEPLEGQTLPLNSDEDLRKDHYVGGFDVPKMLTGLGICGTDQLHGDIEHFYIVDLDEGKIIHYKAGWPDETTYQEFVANREPRGVYQIDEEPMEGIEE